MKSILDIFRTSTAGFALAALLLQTGTLYAASGDTVSSSSSSSESSSSVSSVTSSISSSSSEQSSQTSSVSSTTTTTNSSASSSVDTSTLAKNSTITIDQVSPIGSGSLFGTWTLIDPRNVHAKSNNQHYILPQPRAGKYTIIADAPEGATGKVEFTINGILQTTPGTPQLTFTLKDDQDVTLRIIYTYTRIGSVSVNSNPPGLSFVLKGPDSREYPGKTPESFENMPEGLYTAYFDPLENCPTPKPKSDRLVKDGRANISIDVECEHLVIEGVDEKSEDFVTINLPDGLRIIFDDAPLTSWYAPFVAVSAKSGILSGYKNREGNFTGKFGPQNNVTLAELAKIAHELAYLDETKVHTRPKNERARDQWFNDYWASAEQRYWLVFQNVNDDPNRQASRAEVIATIMQALDKPLGWPKGSIFSDVHALDPYAAAIETATASKLIGGYTDDHGVETGKFGPNNPITRAEIAKIIANALDVFKIDTPNIQTYSDLGM